MHGASGDANLAPTEFQAVNVHRVSAAGKEQLRADTLAAIRKILAEEGAKAEAVEGVYFTSFVIQ